jgi:glutathione peroxidase
MVLGFPSNDFLWQEPGTNEEIKTFCSTKYNVTFDMFAKVSVRGKDATPLYKELTSKKTNGSFGGAIKWNFTKFLVARDGLVVARFSPATKPDDPEVIRAIENELAKTP